MLVFTGRKQRICTPLHSVTREFVQRTKSRRLPDVCKKRNTADLANHLQEMKDAVDFEEAKKFWMKEGKKKYTLPGKGENSSRYCEEEREMIE